MTAASPPIAKSARASLAEWLRDATPALLFALRLWASVCLTYWVTFALQLSDPTWAVTTAAILGRFVGPDSKEPAAAAPAEIPAAKVPSASRRVSTVQHEDPPWRSVLIRQPPREIC